MKLVIRMNTDAIVSLNTNQKEAATTVDRPVRIIAGAGSGKTRVLISRIVYLMEECGILPFRIMAITFTNKAAREMKERLEAAVGDAAKDVRVSTIHSLCVRMLREDAQALGYARDFTILDTEDQRAILRPFYKELDVDKNRFPFSRVLGYISNRKTRRDWLNVQEEMGYNADEIILSQMYERYDLQLSRMRAMDFDDLLLNGLKLLEENENIRTKWQRRLDYIHVDEFQDVDPIQYRIIRDLTGKNTQLCVVGDPDQTIYTWRGASIDIIMHFERDFPNTKTVILNENYRSTQPILSAANGLIANNTNRIKKDLFTNRESTDLVDIKECPDETDEAMYIVRQINELRAKGMPYSDMAILYRANYLSRSLEKGLRSAGVPYQIFGGVRFYERAEIKDMLSYLRLLTRPSENDPADMSKDLGVMRVINQPRRGIGTRTIEKLQALAASKNTNLYDAILSREGISRTIAAKLEYFSDVIEELRQDLEDHELPEMIDLILEKTGYEEMLKANKEEERLENINELKNDILKAVDENPNLTLEEYLQNIALFTEAVHNDAGNAVTLMTVHAAKGLEYPAVFVSNMNEGVFPSTRSVDDGPSQLEEERRLLYVAMTRAKERLYLTWNVGYSYSSNHNKSVSRFIAEIPEEYTVSSLIVQPKKPAPVSTNSFSRHSRRRQGKSLSNNEHFRIGDAVDHAAYGKGTVVAMNGNTATVLFDKTIGIKKLNALHPSLRKAS